MPQPTIRAVQSAICAEFGIMKEELTGNSRCARIAHPRALAILVARELTGSSFPQLGRAFSRHHSTCHSAVRRAHNLIDAFPELLDRVERVREALRSQP